MIIKKYSFLFICSFIVTGLLTNAVWGEVSQMKQPDQKINVQLNPIAFSESLPADYKEMFFNKTDAEMKEIIKEAGYRNKSHNFLLVSEICQNISKNLPANLISFVDDRLSIIVEVSVVKTGIDSLYGSSLIADTVLYKGIFNNEIVFQGEFKQIRKGWFSLTSIKTPEEIGRILSKKIAKEIKKLEQKEQK